MRYTIPLLLAVALISACSDDDSPVQPGPATAMQFAAVAGGANPYGGDPVGAFEIGRYEVLQDEWNAVVPYNPSFYTGGDLPVHNVTWYQAQDFIDSLNARDAAWRYRLPTIGEWTLACAAGTTTDFYTGNRTVTGCTQIDPALDRAGWYCANSDMRPHAAGQKEPNAHGLYDMHGNVPEWCLGAYDSTRHYTKGGGYAMDGEQALTMKLGALLSSCGDDGNQPFGFRLVREKR